MAEIYAFTPIVSVDVDRPERWRWSVFEGKKIRDKSLFSFATRPEAQADADRFVAELNATWRRPL
jgi:hypothetical protein